MAYEDIVNVSISLDVAAVNQAGFGIPIFIDEHMWFAERVRSYPSSAAAAVDLPADSKAYAGVLAAFSGENQPTQVMVGRRASTGTTLTPIATFSAGQVFSVTIKGDDGVSDTATFTSATGVETAASIITGMSLSTLNTASSGATVTGTTDVLVVGTIGITAISGFDIAIATTETATAALAAISLENDDFYFVGASDHSDAFVTAMASAVEATKKEYFVAVQDLDNLDAYSGSGTDQLAVIKDSGRLRTFAFYKDKADTEFPEMGYASVLAASVPGTSILVNNSVSFGAARNASGPLTITEKSNLNDKNASYAEVRGGTTILRNGTSAGNSGFTASLIRNRDYAEARLNEAFAVFLISKKVVPYTRSGIAQSQNIAETTLDTMVSTETQPNILAERNPYTVNFPLREDVPLNDLSNGHLVGSAVLNLAGAIKDITFTANMTFDAIT